MKTNPTSHLRRLLLALVALALVAAACGSDDTSSDGAAETTTEATSDDSGAEPADDGTDDSSSSPDEAVVLRFARFFGDCTEDVAGVTDVTQATTECEVIQILENAFNAEDNGITIEKIGGQAWGDYYTQLSTAFAGGDVPNVAVMHQHRLPDFAGRGLLLPLDDPFASSDVIDFADYTAPAQSAASLDGTVYALRSTSMRRCGTSTPTSMRLPVSPMPMEIPSCRHQPMNFWRSARSSTPPVSSALPTIGSSSASALACSWP